MKEVVGKGFSDPRKSASICVLKLDLNADLRGLTRIEEVVGRFFLSAKICVNLRSEVGFERGFARIDAD